MLVDDDTDDQLFFVDAINELSPDIDCIIANNGLEAINQLEKIQQPPSLIFIDLNMPFMNGFECIAELKKMNQFKEIPIIIFTTSNHTIDMERSTAMGAKVYFTKPSDFIVLRNKLHEILETDFTATTTSL